METISVKKTTIFTAKLYYQLKTKPKPHMETISVKQTTIFTAKSKVAKYCSKCSYILNFVCLSVCLSVFLKTEFLPVCSVFESL